MPLPCSQVSGAATAQSHPDSAWHIPRGPARSWFAPHIPLELAAEMPSPLGTENSQECP